MTRFSRKTCCLTRQIVALLCSACLLKPIARAEAPPAPQTNASPSADILSIVRQQNQQIRKGALAAQGAFGGRTSHDNGVNPAARMVRGAKTVVFI